MTPLDDVEWRRREELRSLLTALRSRRGGNGGKRLRQDDAAILSGLSTRRYAALERGAVENPSLDLIENVASGLLYRAVAKSLLLNAASKLEMRSSNCLRFSSMIVSAKRWRAFRFSGLASSICWLGSPGLPSLTSIDLLKT